MSKIYKSEPAYERAAVTFLAQLTEEDATLIVQADVYGTITYTCYDENDPDTVIVTAALVVSDVIIDSPVAWSKDSTGYNFKYISPGSHRPEGGRTYGHEFILTLDNGSGSAGNIIAWKYQVPTIALSST